MFHEIEGLAQRIQHFSLKALQNWLQTKVTTNFTTQEERKQKSHCKLVLNTGSGVINQWQFNPRQAYVFGKAEKLDVNAWRALNVPPRWLVINRIFLSGTRTRHPQILCHRNLTLCSTRLLKFQDAPIRNSMIKSLTESQVRCVQ